MKLSNDMIFTLLHDAVPIHSRVNGDSSLADFAKKNASQIERTD